MKPKRLMYFCTMFSASSMRLEISTSCSRVSSGTWPICLRYIRTGSSRMSSLVSGFSSSSSSVFLAVLVAIDLGRFDDVDLHRAEPRQDGVEFVRVGDPFGQGVVQIVESEVALFLGELDQLTDAALQIVRCERHAIAFMRLMQNQNFV